jgi:Skp family chaperone for outer membrane proteins
MRYIILVFMMLLIGMATQQYSAAFFDSVKLINGSYTTSTSSDRLESLDPIHNKIQFSSERIDQKLDTTVFKLTPAIITAKLGKIKIYEFQQKLKITTLD